MAADKKSGKVKKAGKAKPVAEEALVKKVVVKAKVRNRVAAVSGQPLFVRCKEYHEFIPHVEHRISLSTSFCPWRQWSCVAAAGVPWCSGAVAH